MFELFTVAKIEIGIKIEISKRGVLIISGRGGEKISKINTRRGMFIRHHRAKLDSRWFRVMFITEHGTKWYIQQSSR